MLQLFPELNSFFHSNTSWQYLHRDQSYTVEWLYKYTNGYFEIWLRIQDKSYGFANESCDNSKLF